MKGGHEFSDEELDKLMYLWDEHASKVVHEYLYMKKEWRNHDENGNDKNISNDVEESYVFLDLPVDTSEQIHVVEFYSPWCPHCIHFRPEYINIAAEVSRRLVGKIQFHGVSCELFPMICRAYGVTSFPVVYGYGVGANIREQGFELNPVDGPEMTVESVATNLNLNLIYESKNSTVVAFNNSDDRKAFELGQANEAAQLKQEWHSYPSSLDERYHNAAASLVFVLKTGIYTGRQDFLDGYHAMALKEFLELIYWTTPQSWHIRTGIIRELLEDFPRIVSGAKNLEAVIDRHLCNVDDHDRLWGGLKHQPCVLNMTVAPKMPTWTHACTHGERSLGFTCGLWDLLHIITVGSSYPEHQLYGFLNGYLVSPADVAEILKRFIEHFFGCEVCRRNFIVNFENCGQNHCERLSTMMPALLGQTESASRQESVELARWMNEMHNVVNVRLMYEGARRQGRTATKEERLAAIFPSVNLCPHCWSNENLTQYDPKHMVGFLYEWYWPKTEDWDEHFKRTLHRRILRRQERIKSSSNAHYSSWSILILSALGLIVLVWLLMVRRRRRGHLASKIL